MLTTCLAAIVTISLAACNEGRQSEESPNAAPPAVVIAMGTPSPIATAAPVPTGPQIIGPERFITQVQAALQLIAERAPQDFLRVQARITTFRFVEAGSGMNVYSKTYSVGRKTAFAPGYSTSEQVVWLAGTIVHDACHSHQYAEGNVFIGKDAEAECLMKQRAAVDLIDDDTLFRDYITAFIEGVDDPENDYWNAPNRHW